MRRYSERIFRKSSIYITFKVSQSPNNPKWGKENTWKMLEYSKKAVKYINSTDRSTKKRLQEAIEKIPFGDIKKLQGVNNGYRLRVGDLVD